MRDLVFFFFHRVFSLTGGLRIVWDSEREREREARVVVPQIFNCTSRAAFMGRLRNCVYTLRVVYYMSMSAL